MIRESDQQVASWSARARARARERKGEEVRVWCALVLVLKLNEERKDVCRAFLMCFKFVIKLIKLIEKFVNY